MLRRMLIGAAALSAAISLGLASAQADQTQPAQPNANPANANPANANPANTNTSPGSDWFRPNSAGPNPGATNTPPAPLNPSASTAPGDFPSDLVGQWVDAATRMSMSRAIYGQSQIDLAAAIRRAQARFERSKDYQKALDAEEQAYADYLAARQKAVAGLQQDPRYAELLRMQADLAHRLSAGRQDHELNHDDILAMAELKLSYASEARAMEVSSLDADASVKDARDKMVTASRQVADMRSDFDFALPDNSDVIAARQRMENARIAYLTASSYLNASSIAASVAVNYASYVDGPTQPRVYNYADPFGYGYGGGVVSPYWTRY